MAACDNYLSREYVAKNLVPTLCHIMKNQRGVNLVPGWGG